MNKKKVEMRIGRQGWGWDKREGVKSRVVNVYRCRIMGK